VRKPKRAAMKAKKEEREKQELFQPHQGCVPPSPHSNVAAAGMQQQQHRNDTASMPPTRRFNGNDENFAVRPELYRQRPSSMHGSGHVRQTAPTLQPQWDQQRGFGTPTRTTRALDVEPQRRLPHQSGLATPLRRQLTLEQRMKIAEASSEHFAAHSQSTAQALHPNSVSMKRASGNLSCEQSLVLPHFTFVRHSLNSFFSCLYVQGWV